MSMTPKEYTECICETAILNRQMLEMNIQNQEVMKSVFSKLEQWLDLEIMLRKRESSSTNVTPEEREPV